jgi:hypothetical protein
MTGLNAAVVLSVLVLLLPARALPVGASSDSTTTTLANSCASSVSVNNPDTISGATNNALSSAAYSQGILGYYNVTYNSIFETGHFTSAFPQCSHDVTSYNVVFIVHNSTGGDAGALVVGETASLAVTGYTIQPPVYANTNNPVWSGQEVSDSSQTFEAVSADWTQSTPSAPSDSGDVGCGAPETCNLALWVGLIDNSQGLSDGYLDQAGTFANCNTSSSSSTTCSSYTYHAFYEALDDDANQAVLCNSTANGGDVTLSGGDAISADVWSGAYYGGSSSTYYFYVDDTSSGTYCSMSLTDSGGNARTYGEAMAENYEQGPINSKYVKLADFNNPSFTDANIYLTSSTHGYFNDYATATTNMVNQASTLGVCSGAITDATGGSLNSVGDFSVTWDTSKNTPFWGIYCPA